MMKANRSARLTSVAVAVAALAFGGCKQENEGNILHGNVDDRELELAFVLSERVAKVIPEEEATVRKGDLIAEPETVRIDNEVAVAKAEVATSEALLSGGRGLRGGAGPHRSPNRDRPRFLSGGLAQVPPLLIHSENEQSANLVLPDQGCSHWHST